jgi:micrococcal nuclease
VVDGDTIDCKIDVGFGLSTTHRLRLYGVNTPELHAQDAFVREQARRAKDYTTDCVLNKDVMIQTYKSDVFGRYLAKVFMPINETEYECLNDLLLEQDLAVPFMTDTDLLS